MSRPLPPAHARRASPGSRVTAAVVGVAVLLLVLLLAYLQARGHGHVGAPAPAPSATTGSSPAQPSLPATGSSPTGDVAAPGATPSGAPGTGGGGGPGLRSPVLLAVGIVLLYAAIAALLVRVWPSARWD